MHRPRPTFLVAAACVLLAVPATAQHTTSLEVARGFIANRGQWDADACFIAPRGGMRMRAERGAFSLALPAPDPEVDARLVVRLAFEGASTAGVPEGRTELPTTYNFFLGNDPDRWASQVPAFEEVIYRDLYPGIDVRLHEVDGRFVYDLVLGAGADASRIAVRVEGIEALSLDDAGDLVFETALGPIVQQRPRTWVRLPDGDRRAVACRYRVIGDRRFGFDVSADAAGQPLVIDPGLEWATFLGGVIPAPGNNVSGNLIADVAVLADRSTVAVGWTGRVDFPTTPGVVQAVHSQSFADGFVTRIAPSGDNLIFSTFLGGTHFQQVRHVAVTTSGSLIVAGVTSSSDYPVTPGAFSNGPPSSLVDPFITRLNSTGSVLEYSLVLALNQSTGLNGLALLHSEEPVIAGGTLATDFPLTPNGIDGTQAMGEAFVAHFSLDGKELKFATLLGGSLSDGAGSVAVAPDGTLVIGGNTRSHDFPITPGSFKPTHSPGQSDSDGFIARIDPVAGKLLHSTFQGAQGGDFLRALAVDSFNEITIGGIGFIEEPPSGFTCPFCFEVYVARFDPTLSSVVWSARFGGAGADDLWDLALDSSRAVTFCGDSLSDNAGFPTTKGAFEENWTSGGRQAWVARLSPDGKELLYSTSFGGSAGDGASVGRMAVALDHTGAATVCGNTASINDFPVTPGAFQTEYRNVFIARFDMLPAGVSRFGESTPGCGGPLAIGVTSMPYVGNGAFGLTCTDAPPHANGFVALSAGKLDPPHVTGGVSLGIDPAAMTLFPVQSDAVGWTSSFRMPLRSHVLGKQFYAQFFWLNDPCAPNRVSASQALDITVMPP